MNPWHDIEVEKPELCPALIEIPASSKTKFELDILVLGQAVVYPLSIMRAKPIGFLRMLDQGKLDDKIIAVHADDPEFLHYNDISELAPHIFREIKNFFEIYKNLEDKKVDVQGFQNRDAAIKVIVEALDLYKKTKPK